LQSGRARIARTDSRGPVLSRPEQQGRPEAHLSTAGESGQRPGIRQYRAFGRL